MLWFWTIFALLPPNNAENQNFEKWKTPGDIMRYCHFTQVYHEWKWYDVWFLSSRQNVFLFWIIFYPFNPLTTQKIKILKNWKKHLECHHDAHVYHKSKSYDVYFLRHGLQLTAYFAILDHFLLFYHPNNLENQKIEKNAWRYHFTHVYHKWKPDDVWFLRYGVLQREFFSHFGPFFALLLPYLTLIKILSKKLFDTLTFDIYLKVQNRVREKYKKFKHKT